MTPQFPILVPYSKMTKKMQKELLPFLLRICLAAQECLGAPPILKLLHGIKAEKVPPSQ